MDKRQAYTSTYKWEKQAPLTVWCCSYVYQLACRINDMNFWGREFLHDFQLCYQWMNERFDGKKAKMFWRSSLLLRTSQCESFISTYLVISVFLRCLWGLVVQSHRVLRRRRRRRRQWWWWWWWFTCLVSFNATVRFSLYQLELWQLQFAGVYFYRLIVVPRQYHLLRVIRICNHISNRDAIPFLDRWSNRFTVLSEANAFC